MQNLAHTPAAAQHIPDGWSFPSAAQPRPLQAVAVSGGGAAPATVTRVRWGRILPVLAGIGLLAFGIWSATNESAPAPARSVSGSEDLAIADNISAKDAATPAATADTASKPEALTPTPAITRRAKPAAKPVAQRAGGRRPARRAARRATAINAFAAATAGATSASGAGAGTGAGAAPSGQLPMTGLSTWIAAALGVLLLGLGICVQVNAVRLGMTALLYRRGILLRPVDCARLAQEHGLSRARVGVSNVLHRLLAEPMPSGGEFVTARRA